MIDLDSLNPPQRQAVTHEGGPLLVLAGAGSGKTRVITYRIAHLIQERGVDGGRIMAVTFTNKAASEMLGRVSRLVPSSSRPAIGTFHSTSLRILRKYADRLNYGHSFAVYDAADQMTLVRRCAREVGIDEDTLPARKILNRISAAKNELHGPAEFERRNTDFVGGKVSAVYRLYQKRLHEFDAMDFDDLIGKYVELLRAHPEVRQAIHDRFQHLLIDEYQDTNHAQYTLIRELSGPLQNVVAVGDDDQSIYKFRGADISNILNFERDFPGATIVKLEQNYRSTGNILDAATAVVSKNVGRKGKKLFTDQGGGNPVRVVTCETEREEAGFVLARIQELRSSVPLSEMAVLFRTNAQSRPFEEELLRAKIPYSVVGGVKFYERAEIKDVLSFMRLAVRPHDTPSVERVINVPSRGIGDTTLKALNDEAKAKEISLWAVIDGEQPFLPERARKAIAEFREIVHDLQRAAGSPVHELLELALLRTGYRKMFVGSRDPQDESRLQNIDELINSAREFQEMDESSTLADYLDSVSLLSDVDRYDNQKGITLMTLHAAKGLEFKVVFLAGMEEGVLPHAQSMQDADIEEERRLCYVGMTRARDELYCLHALARRMHGQYREQSPSPFLLEIPPRIREDISLAGIRAAPPSRTPSWYERAPAPSQQRTPRPPMTGNPSSRPSVSAQRPGSGGNVASFFSDGPVQFDPSALRPASATPSATPSPAGAPGEYKRGTRVRHQQFGTGVILTIEGKGENAKLNVYFDRHGAKKFIAKYAKLEKI